MNTAARNKSAEYPVAVTVLMPAFEAAATIGDAVRSVIAQSFVDWELVVVDDGSRDETHAAAMKLAERDPRIRVLRHVSNLGAAAARNTALSAARGRRIAFLDADDLWMSEKLARQIAFMEETNTALSYTGFWRELAKDGQRRDPPQMREIVVPPTVTREQLLRGNVIGCLTACYDRAQLGDMPMPQLRLRQDFALWLDILSRIDLAKGLAEPLAIYRSHQGSLSSGRVRAARATWEMYRRHLRLGRTRSAVYLGLHLVARVFRG